MRCSGILSSVDWQTLTDFSGNLTHLRLTLKDGADNVHRNVGKVRKIAEERNIPHDDIRVQNRKNYIT